MSRTFAPLVLSIIALASAIATEPAMAAGRGDGGCVITPKAPIYRNSRDDKVIGTKDVGDCVAGATGIISLDYLFDEENGRVGIMYFPNKEGRGSYQRGWMNSTDLTRFTFECGCSTFSGSPSTACTPFALSSGFDFAYNSCFKEAQDKKKAEIFKQGAATPASATVAVEGGANAKGAEKVLRNDDILTLVKVGLDDKLIISKIRAAKATDFDLSTEGIVALKTAMVSNAVIDVMMKRADKKR